VVVTSRIAGEVSAMDPRKAGAAEVMAEGSPAPHRRPVSRSTWSPCGDLWVVERSWKELLIAAVRG
jgi:hypothetical protein